MNSLIFEQIENLIASNSNITKKTVKKLLGILISNPVYLDNLINSLQELKKKFSICKDCNNIIISKCKFCSNSNRHNNKLILVSNQVDIEKIESTNNHNGLYYIFQNELGMKTQSLDLLHLSKFISKYKINHIILAINPTINGETTANYLALKLKSNTVNIFRIGYGLPIGLNIENIDSFSLSNSLKNKRKY